MNDTELRALLSNALENAISTENAYVGKIDMEGDLPKSNKKEAGHGFGIKSMLDIVERHGGLYSFETEGGVFVMQLLLPLGK